MKHYTLSIKQNRAQVHRVAHHALQYRRHGAGFSLVELMLALLIGLFLIIGMLNMFAGNRLTYRQTENISILHANIRFITDVFTRELRGAGEIDYFLDENGHLTLAITRARPYQWCGAEAHALATVYYKVRTQTHVDQTGQTRMGRLDCGAHHELMRGLSKDSSLNVAGYKYDGAGNEQRIFHAQADGSIVLSSYAQNMQLGIQDASVLLLQFELKNDTFVVDQAVMQFGFRVSLRSKVLNTYYYL